MPPSLTSASELADAILVRRRSADPSRAFLVGISGIDGSGKGWVAAEVAARLREAGPQVVSLNVDGWLNLPHIRFNQRSPASHFYRHALRLDGFFTELLRPLQIQRAVDMVADYAEETAQTFRAHRYAYENVDIVLAEGIFLFRSPYRSVFDLTVWVACSFETALERAIARAQEGLTPEETARAYHTTYFPAQRLHARLDAPETHADYTLPNDPRLARHDLKLPGPGRPVS